ncbi:MAG: hypothetical protein GY854_14480 [Deltaproteobacteria bacterium]|nr:hypothetical protein [Deltaproteobacteria bacterium]
MRYLVGLGAVALFILLAQVKVQYSIRQQSRDSRVVNIAGRQRMLSQRLSKAVLAIPQAKSKPEQMRYIQEMRDTIALWALSHRALQYGSPKLDLPPTLEKEVLSKYTAIDPYFQTMLAAAKRFVDAPLDRSSGTLNSSLLERTIKVILKNERPFLVGMDEIVFAHDSSAKSKVTYLKYTEVVLLVLALAVLVAVGLFVFEPSVRLTRKQFAEVSRIAAERRELINELEGALATVKQLHGLLPICASCKKIRNDEGCWTQLEIYIEEHSRAEFTHGICPDCQKQLYPGFENLV